MYIIQLVLNILPSGVAGLVTGMEFNIYLAKMLHFLN